MMATMVSAVMTASARLFQVKLAVQSASHNEGEHCAFDHNLKCDDDLNHVTDYQKAV
jgi:hypothetical protein